MSDRTISGATASQSPAPRARYRRIPDIVEAMQWNPADASMQDVLTWVREEGQVFKTVGRQLWIEFGDERKSWMIVHPGEYVVRKTGDKRFFYAEPAERFERTREPEALTQTALPSPDSSPDVE